jgi:hypothetical protein
VTTKTELYAIQSLAANGFAVMRSTVAYRLRPDLWSSGEECGNTFQSKSVDSMLEGVRRLNVVFEGSEDVMKVLTRSMDRLAERMEWVTGFRVLGIEEEKPAAPVQEKTAPTEAQKKAAERLQELKKLAAMDLPPHDCVRRKDILEARRELGMAAD